MIATGRAVVGYRRTYRPHIRRLRCHFNSLMGYADWTFMQWWICEGFNAEGTGATQKAAYDAWYQQFIKRGKA